MLSPWAKARALAGIKPTQTPVLNYAHPLVRGLVGFWLLHEGAGKAAYNVFTAARYKGTFNGTTIKWTAASQGRGVQFTTGGADYIDVGDVTEMNSVGALTLSARYKRTAAASACYIEKAVDANNRVGIEVFTDGNVYFQLSTAGTQRGLVSFTDATAFHTATLRFDGSAVGNSGRLRGWLDRQERTLSYAGTIGATTPNLASNNLCIGRYAPGPSYSNATVEYVALWNRALDPAEIIAFESNPYDMFFAPGPRIPLLFGIADRNVDLVKTELVPQVQMVPPIVIAGNFHGDALTVPTLVDVSLPVAPGRVDVSPATTNRAVPVTITRGS